MDRKFAVAIIALIVAHSDPSFAQEQGVYEAPSVGESTVVIASEANVPIRFSLRPANGTWAEYTVDPGNNITITCNQCSTPYFEIGIRTEDRSVTDHLEPSQRFLIKWNYDRRLWDIYRITG